MDKIKTSGYFFGFAAVFLWSWNVIISRYLADLVPAFQISFGRWVFALLALLPFTAKSLWQYRYHFLRSWKLMLVMGFTLAFQNYFVYRAGHTSMAIDMSLIATTGPLFMVLMSALLFKIFLSKRQLIGLILAFLGVLVVITHGSLLNLKGFHFVSGDFWMLMDALFFGFYSVIQTKKDPVIPHLTLLCGTIVLSLIILFPFFLYTLPAAPLSELNGRSWGLIIYLGVFNSIFGYLWWNIALEKLGNVQTGLMYYTIPLFSTTEAFFLLHEKIYESQIWGGLLVLTGIILASFHTKKAGIVGRP